MSALFERYDQMDCGLKGKAILQVTFGNCFQPLVVLKSDLYIFLANTRQSDNVTHH